MMDETLESGFPLRLLLTGLWTIR